jgi:hypothetical protein
MVLRCRRCADAGQWSFFLLTKQVPELKSRPAEIGLHIAAEFITALLVSGLGLLTRAAWGTIAYLVATGMLLYSYFAKLQ